MPPKPRGPNAPGQLPHGPFPGPGPGPDGHQRQHPSAPPRMPQRVMEPEMRARFPRPNVQVTQHGMNPRQERHQKKGRRATRWDNPLPPVNSSQMTSGKFAEEATRIQNRYTIENASGILASFGLSDEDLEELSRYPDDQLTSENMPLILRDIRMRKMTHQLPSLPSQSTEKEMFHSDDGCGTMVKCKVIDYGHKSKFEYTETPLEVKDYNSDASTEGSVKGFSNTVSSALSGLTSSQMNAVEELIRKMGFQRSTSSTQSFPPMDASNKGPGEGLPPAGAGMPPPFGVVKASWLPVISQADAQKLKKLPTPSMMHDYYAASPRIFPHVCSLCNVECGHLKEWNLHVGTTAHSEKCDQLRQQYPDWNAEDCSLLQRHEGDKKEKHIAMPRSASSNPNGSQHTVPGHASSQTRSQCRSPGSHSRKRSRSRSSERFRRKRSRSRSFELCRRKRSRSRSSERCRRKRSQSRSSERCRRKRSRSRSSERCRRKRSPSRSSERCRRKRSQSRSSERCRRKRSPSRGPRCNSRSSKQPSSPRSSSQSSSSRKRELRRSTRSPALSAEAGSSRQPPAKSDVAEESPKKLDAQKLKTLPTPSMMNDYYAACPRIYPHVCSLCNIKCRHLKEWNLHVGTTAHSEKCDQLRQQHPDWNAEDSSLLQRHEGDKKEKHIAMPCSGSSNPNGSQHTVPGHASSQTQSRCRSPGSHSRKRSRSRSSERCRRKRSRSRSSERCRRKRSPSRSSERCRRKRSPSRSSERCRRKRSPSRGPRCNSRSSKQPSSPRSSSQSSSSRKREPRRSTRSPALSAEAGSSRQPPAKSDVAEEPPKKLDAQKLKTLPTPSMMNDYYAASPRIFPHVCSLCNIKCRHLKGWNLHVGTTAHSEKCDQLRQQHPDWNAEDCSLLQRHEGDKKEKHIPLPCSTSSKLNSSQPPNKSENPLQTNHGHQELEKKEAATQEQGDRQHEDRLSLALRPLAEQSVMQALSLLQSEGTVGAGLAEGTSSPPLPSVQINSASLSLVSMIQLVATQVVQAALASKETSGVQESPSAAGPSSPLSIAAGSEEKKQESSQEVVPGVAPSCSGLAAVRIWIVGNNIVHFARLRAVNSGLGSRLGLPDHVSVSWMSRRGMRWDEFLPMVRAKVSCEGPPTAMVVHLGENDLVLVHSLSLRSSIKEDLEELVAAHPGLKIFWSQLLQRRVWLGSHCPTAIERARKRMDSFVSDVVLELGGALIHHPGITLKDPALYKPDGVNLSIAGNDVWLSEVSVGLKGWLQV